MNHLDYIVPSYALTIAALVGALAWSWTAMRRAEAAADTVRRR